MPPESARGGKSTCLPAREPGPGASRSGGRRGGLGGSWLSWPFGAPVLARACSLRGAVPARPKGVFRRLTQRQREAKSSAAFRKSGIQRGKTRAGDQAPVRQLRGEVLRSQKGPDRLPEVR